MTVRVTRSPEGLPEVILFQGGPLDGKSWSELDGGEVKVVMSDGQKHRYVRTAQFGALSDRSHARVFVWVGRYYGPE